MLLEPIGFPATGPPLGIYPDAPAALIVTEGLRLWSPTPELELVGVFPLTIADAPPTAGTAGGMATLPFTGELASGLPFCAGIWAAGADGAGVPDADDGGKGFLVALA